MERKIVSGIMLTLLLMGVLSMAIHIVPAFTEDHPAQAIWVEPDYFDTLEKCDNFTVSVMINITDPPGPATGLFGWEYHLKWNTSEINLTSHVEPDLTDPAGLNWASGFWVKKNVVTDGDVWCAATAFAPDPAFTGVTWLSNYTFHVEHQAARAYVGHILMDLEGLTDDQVGDLVPPFTDKKVVEFHVMGLQRATAVYFNLNPNPVTVGQKVTLKGILVDEFSQSLSNEAVKLYARPLAGSWKYITSLTTNEYGIFTWQATIPVTGTFIFAAYYPGSETYESTYNLAILIAQPPLLVAQPLLQATAVYFNLNPNPVTVGQKVTLKGILVDEFSQSLSNEAVKLYARPLAGSWKYITSLTTNEYGIFTWQAKIPAGVTGTYTFAAYYPGSETYESTYNLAILIIQ